MLFRIMKSYTNRHMGATLKELMLRIQLEKEVDSKLHSIDEKDSQLVDLFCNHHVLFHILSSILFGLYSY